MPAKRSHACMLLQDDISVPVGVRPQAEMARRRKQRGGQAPWVPGKPPLAGGIGLQNKGLGSRLTDTEKPASPRSIIANTQGMFGREGCALSMPTDQNQNRWTSSHPTEYFSERLPVWPLSLLLLGFPSSWTCKSVRRHAPGNSPCRLGLSTGGHRDSQIRTGVLQVLP